MLFEIFIILFFTYLFQVLECTLVLCLKVSLLFRDFEFLSIDKVVLHWKWVVFENKILILEIQLNFPKDRLHLKLYLIYHLITHDIQNVFKSICVILTLKFKFSQNIFCSIIYLLNVQQKLFINGTDVLG